MQSVDVLIQPVVSEKAVRVAGQHQYAFIVATGARKEEIRKAVEAHYDVTVTGITTAQFRQSPRRQTKRRIENTAVLGKKAYVTLKAGQTLDLLGSTEE
jgi:large subunit ribosomal protein L23